MPDDSYPVQRVVCTNVYITTSRTADQSRRSSGQAPLGVRRLLRRDDRGGAQQARGMHQFVPQRRQRDRLQAASPHEIVLEDPAAQHAAATICAARNRAASRPSHTRPSGSRPSPRRGLKSRRLSRQRSEITSAAAIRTHFAHHRVRREPLPRQRVLLHRLGKLIRDMGRTPSATSSSRRPMCRLLSDRLTPAAAATSRSDTAPTPGTQTAPPRHRAPPGVPRPAPPATWLAAGASAAGSVRVAHRLNRPRTPQRSRSAATPASNPRSLRRASASLCAVTGGSAPPVRVRRARGRHAPSL